MKEQDFVAGQDFLLAVKKHWTTQMYPAVKQLHADIGDGADETADVAKRLEPETDYRLFAWFERHLQKMKYSGGFGLAPYHRERADTLLASLSDPLEAETLQLDDRFDQPDYYTSVDIHQHPGGVWSEPVSGLIYERGARSTTPMLNAAHRDLHDRFTESIRDDDRLDVAAPAILDMGLSLIHI